MKKRATKATVWLLSLIPCAALFFTGCTPQTKVYYDTDTLKNEYLRDTASGVNFAIPENYFPNDDPTQEPHATWRAHAQLLYTNWLNYYVYQTTPYDIDAIGGADAN